MKKRLWFLFVFLSIIKIEIYAQITPNAILNKHRYFILENEKLTSIKTLLNTFNQKTGKWTDINYDNQSMANWAPLNHLLRINDLSLAWSLPNSKNYHNQQLLAVINKALKNWDENDYKCKNWWFNEIGVPQAILTSIVLLKDEWNAQQLNDALKILSQYKINGTGANLTWSAKLGLYYGLLTNNDSLVTKTAILLQNEIVVSQQEGIQPDYSFHQHGERLQISHYGESFIYDNLRLAWELNGSKWAFPKPKIEILYSALLEGVQWMTRGINNAPGTLDRAVSRKGKLKTTMIYLSLIPHLLNLLPEHHKDIIQFKEELEGKYTLKGFRYFPNSDFAAYQQPQFSFFLKTISSRTLPTESINSENLKGELLNSGDGYLIANGNEYFDLMPVWKWNCLPGLTTFIGAEKIIRQNFNGALSNGSFGFSAMDYKISNSDESQNVSAKKMWANYQNVVVCLIADIKSTTDIYTTLDQCRLQTEVLTDKGKEPLKSGNTTFSSLKWIHQGNFSYIPIQKDSIDVFTGRVSGKWSSINKSQSDSLVVDSVFMPILKHNKDVKETGYILTYSKTVKETKQLLAQPFWRILKNNATAQIVAFKNEIMMASIYSPTAFLYHNLNIKIDIPCLMMIEGNKLYASDPTHQGKTVHIQINEKSYIINMPSDGNTSKPVEFKI